MRSDRLLLRSGYVAGLCFAGLLYLLGAGISATLASLIAAVLLTRISIYLYFERFLAFKTFEEFTSGRIRHECVACGASCHLRVNLEKNDVERILKHATEAGMKDTVIEKSGSRYWLKRNPDGACVFLTYSEGLPRCSIYTIRPIACRLFPLIPTGKRLKVDPFCPGLSQDRGHTFKEHLVTQEVASYVRKVMGKI